MKTPHRYITFMPRYLRIHNWWWWWGRGGISWSNWLPQTHKPAHLPHLTNVYSVLKFSTKCLCIFSLKNWIAFWCTAETKNLIKIKFISSFKILKFLFIIILSHFRSILKSIALVTYPLPLLRLCLEDYDSVKVLPHTHQHVFVSLNMLYYDTAGKLPCPRYLVVPWR